MPDIALKITNKAARLFLLPLGGGKILRIAPLATVEVQIADVEHVAAALDGPLKPHVERKHLVIERLDVIPPSPPPNAMPPMAAPEPPPSASVMPAQPAAPPSSPAPDASAPASSSASTTAIEAPTPAPSSSSTKRK